MTDVERPTPEARRSEIVLVRHGATAWTNTGQHTSHTDLPLTEAGRGGARALKPRLAGRAFASILTSPLRRAAETCALAGFEPVAQSCDDLREWDYGSYEGRTTVEIRAERPGWSLWRDGTPDGETLTQVAARADSVLRRLDNSDGDALLFAHGHLLRVLAARWVDLEPSAGRLLQLDPLGIGILGWEREQPVLVRWNEPPT